jgi:hypothetical protein
MNRWAKNGSVQPKMAQRLMSHGNTGRAFGPGLRHLAGSECVDDIEEDVESEGVRTESPSREETKQSDNDEIQGTREG